MLAEGIVKLLLKNEDLALLVIEDDDFGSFRERVDGPFY